jgi:hypothetical protein
MVSTADKRGNESQREGRPCGRNACPAIVSARTRLRLALRSLASDHDLFLLCLYDRVSGEDSKIG